MKNKIIKLVYILISITLIIPSIIYIIQKKTIMGFTIYYNFAINTEVNKILSTSIYLILFIALSLVYLLIIRKKEIFKDIKSILKYVIIVSLIFFIMLPWTSSDVFYYMGVGELDSKYKQNPYYVTMKEYYTKNQDNIDDEILEQGANNFWANTTVVYGPISQLIFKICTAISMKNIDICLIVFKLINLMIHILNCYLIYKISNMKKFVIIYGLNPFILLEFIGNVHNDIIVVFFILLTLYFLCKKKNLLLSILFLAIATGIKYFSVLLLPIIILYYFRDEKSILKKFCRCIQYGIIFLLILLIEYIPYLKDINVLFAMMAQNSKYSKSMYSALLTLDLKVNLIRIVFITSFVYVFICICLEFLFKQRKRLIEMLRKYNITLILFLLILKTFQQWYLIWLFATIMWQRPNTIKNIIGLSLISEIANSIYMYRAESYIYDIQFVGIIICLFIAWQIITNKWRKKSEKVSFN